MIISLTIISMYAHTFPPQELDDNLAGLTKEFEEATSAKLRCQQEAESTANTISLANRSGWTGVSLHACIYTCMCISMQLQYDRNCFI